MGLRRRPPPACAVPGARWRPRVQTPTAPPFCGRPPRRELTIADLNHPIRRLYNARIVGRKDKRGAMLALEMAKRMFLRSWRWQMEGYVEARRVWARWTSRRLRAYPSRGNRPAASTTQTGLWIAYGDRL